MLKFKYSIIKYTPDHRRGETVNVGLVVFTENPDKPLDVRVISSAAKVRMLDGVTDINEIIGLKVAMENIAAIVGSSIDLHDAINSFGSTTGRLGCTGYFTIDEINQYERRVENLFNELVRPFATRESTTKTSRIHTILKNKFESLELLGKDTDDLSKHKVIHNYLISDKTGITADFLLKNGKYHITEAIDFNVNDIQAKFKETTMKVMTFMEGKKLLGLETASYFVYTADTSREAQILPHLNLVEDYSDRIFNITSAHDKAEYFSLISSLAGRDLLRLH